MNKFTCPGFVFYPRKPHPKGNTYQTICYGKSGIMYVWKIFEGKDNLITMGITKFKTSINLKTAGLVLLLTRVLWSTGKELIIDIGFCVLKGLFGNEEEGIYEMH